MSDMQPKLITVTLIITATACYLIGVVTGDQPLLWVLPMMVVVLLWLLAVVQNWRTLSAAALLLALGVSGAGVIIGFSPLLMTGSAVAALGAWQSAHMAWRFSRAQRLEQPERLFGSLLLRLLLFGTVSIGIAIIPTLVSLQLSFLAAVPLALAAIVALSMVVRRLTEQESA